MATAATDEEDDEGGADCAARTLANRELHLEIERMESSMEELPPAADDAPIGAGAGSPLVAAGVATMETLLRLLLLPLLPLVFDNVFPPPTPAAPPNFAAPDDDEEEEEEEDSLPAISRRSAAACKSNLSVAAFTLLLGFKEAEPDEEEEVEAFFETFALRDDD